MNTDNFFFNAKRNISDEYNRETFLSDNFINTLDYTKEYIENSYPDFFNIDNFRSDTFQKTHNGLHILFSGCSVTSGVGLLKEEIWAYDLYKKIKVKSSTSGFYNMGVGGLSNFSIISNLFRYFKEYGNPDYIFINLTSMSRFYNLSQDKKRIVHSVFSDQSSPVLEVLLFDYYTMLEQYCLSNDIKLFSFSWNTETSNFMLNKFSTFYTFNTDRLIDLLNNKEKFAEKARDGRHFGTAYHRYWSESMFDIVSELLYTSTEDKEV